MTTIIIPPFPEAKRGRPCLNAKAMSSTERTRKQREIENSSRLENIAVLDMETDPFDNVNQGTVYPFCAVLHAADFGYVVIWEDDPEKFVESLLRAINDIEEPHTIYAHNGGRFDFMFLIHKLRGRVSFKGRGIMSAKIGIHEIRDSFHIIPEKLAAYNKDEFDYNCLAVDKRQANKDVIISYCKNDCAYLLDIVKSFIEEFGLKISIGQAAMFELKKKYKWKRLGEQTDAYFRNFFFGGRVECIAGKGHFVGDYRLYDVNSMYPFVMANYMHPVGNTFNVRRGVPGPNTCFVVLECRNAGALICRSEDGATTANVQRGKFFTTIWEYRVAQKYNLLSDVKIKHCIDFTEKTNFSEFVVPLYDKRQQVKTIIKQRKKDKAPEDEEHFRLKKDDMFLKFLLNNAYGKFAQNPRRFKESYITSVNERVPDGEGDGWGDLPAFENDTHAIWERPSPNRLFNNVATAASITGAARSVLLEAIQNADDPVYCDTDSLICKSLHNHNLDPVLLGAWDLEEQLSEVIVVGKKTYACKPKDWSGDPKALKLRSKGVSPPRWEDYLRMLQGDILEVLSKGPTLNKRGEQYYMKRKIRATAVTKTRHQQRISCHGKFAR